MNLLAAFADIFVNPWLVAGLVFTAAPIIIHLLNKRRYKVHDWAAMDFLLKAAVTNRRRLKLEDLLLLLLRILLIAFLVLAVARPILKGIAGWREDERIVVLDDSASMEVVVATGSLFERARESAISQVEDAIGGSTPVSVRLGSRPELTPGRIEGRVRGGLVAPAPGDSGDPALKAAEATSELYEKMRSVRTSALSLRLGKVFDQVIEEARADASPRLRSLVLVSDFRRRDWLRDDGSLADSLDGAFEELKRQGLSDRLRLQLVDVGEPSVENLAVTALRVEDDHVLAGVETRIAVEVTNFGKNTRKGISGEVEIGRPDEQRFSVAHGIPLPPPKELPPGESLTVEVRHVFERAGKVPLRVRLEPEWRVGSTGAGTATPRLEVDDESYTVVSVRQALEVIVVDGDPSADRFGGESGYVLAALSPRGDAPSGVLPRRLDGEITTATLEGADVVLILNRQGCTASETEALARFVSEGGGLGFFLGNKVEPERYRALTDVSLGRPGVATQAPGDERLQLFPVDLRASGPAPEAGKGYVLRFQDFQHPAFELFRGVEGSSLEAVQFAQHSDVVPRSGSTVVARFDDGTPAIVEGVTQKGTVVVFNTTADRDWTDWPTDPSYPIVLQEWVRYLAPRRSEESALEAGQPFTWRVTPGMVYEVVPPNGEPVRAPETDDTVDQGAGSGGGPAEVVTFRDTYQAGFYHVLARPRNQLDREGAGELVASFACRLPTRESDLEPLGETRLRAVLDPSGVQFAVGSDIEVDAFRRSQEGEIWRWLALAAGLFLLVELAGCWWLGRR